MEGKGHSEYTAPSSAIRAKRLGSSKSIRSKSLDSGRPYPPEPVRTSGKTAALLEQAARSRKEGLQSTPAPPEMVRLRRRSGKTA